MRIAHHTGVGGTARQVFVHEVLDDEPAELIPDIQHKMGKPMLYRRHTRVVKTVQVAAPGLFFGRARTRVIPCFHGDAYYFIALIVQHESRNGTIDTTTHCNQDFSFTAHKYYGACGLFCARQPAAPYALMSGLRPTENFVKASYLAFPRS